MNRLRRFLHVCGERAIRKRRRFDREVLFKQCALLANSELSCQFAIAIHMGLDVATWSRSDTSSELIYQMSKREGRKAWKRFRGTGND